VPDAQKECGYEETIDTEHEGMYRSMKLGGVSFEEWAGPSSSHSSLFCLVCGNGLIHDHHIPHKSMISISMRAGVIPPKLMEWTHRGIVWSKGKQ
jgi:hypothetical protein